MTVNVFFSMSEMPQIQPMVISIWCGFNSKPNNLDAYLRPFVTELEEILEHGVSINGHRIAVRFRCCICDAPARAYIKSFYIISSDNILSEVYECELF